MAAPESMVEDEAGNVYAGLIDGRIVRIAPSDDGSPAEGAIETLAKIEFNKDTVRSVHDKTSARPLGECSPGTKITHTLCSVRI